MNKKGQALVEFVMILPVFIFLLIGMVDVGNIIYQKYKLENDLDYVASLVKNQKYDVVNSYSNENGFITSYEKNGLFIKITLSKKISISTPGLNNVISGDIQVERSIIDETIG